MVKNQWCPTIRHQFDTNTESFFLEPHFESLVFNFNGYQILVFKVKTPRVLMVKVKNPKGKKNLPQGLVTRSLRDKNSFRYKMKKGHTD